MLLFEYRILQVESTNPDRILNIDPAKAEIELNKLAKEGYRVIFVHPERPCGLFVLERERPPESRLSDEFEQYVLRYDEQYLDSRNEPAS